MKIVTAAIIKKDRSILLTRRKSGEKLEGFWEFPGGKLEDGESPQECLERELFEELGVASKAGDIFAESIFHYDHVTIKLLGIETKLIGRKLTLNVHDKAKWIPIKNLLEYRLAPADIPIAKKIIKEFGNV